MKTTTAPTLLPLVFLASIFVTGCLKRELVEEQSKNEQEEKEQAHGHSHGDGHDHDHGDGHSHDHSDGGEHAHGHDETPHHGIVVPIWTGQNKVGFAELKLHDDKGDLELWLTEDEKGTKPFDLAKNSVITVTFPELNDKAVKLKIRNGEKNEDEDGKANIRGNNTNYFIFPGDTGADASFLLGKKFVSKVVISFANTDTRYVTDEFVLKPHTH